MQHIAIEGLETAGGIQGAMADAMVALLKFHKVEPTIKWVDDFVFFRSPQILSSNSSFSPSFNFNLSTILGLTKSLGLPWHPISKKGHYFQSLCSYVSLEWNIASRTVPILTDKHLQLVSKLSLLLTTSTSSQ